MQVLSAAADAKGLLYNMCVKDQACKFPETKVSAGECGPCAHAARGIDIETECGSPPLRCWGKRNQRRVEHASSYVEFASSSCLARLLPHMISYVAYVKHASSSHRR